MQEPALKKNNVRKAAKVSKQMVDTAAVREHKRSSVVVAREAIDGEEDEHMVDEVTLVDFNSAEKPYTEGLGEAMEGLTWASVWTRSVDRGTHGGVGGQVCEPV